MGGLDTTNKDAKARGWHLGLGKADWLAGPEVPRTQVKLVSSDDQSFEVSFDVATESETIKSTLEGASCCACVL